MQGQQQPRHEQRGLAREGQGQAEPPARARGPAPGMPAAAAGGLARLLAAPQTLLLLACTASSPASATSWAVLVQWSVCWPGTALARVLQFWREYWADESAVCACGCVQPGPRAVRMGDKSKTRVDNSVTACPGGPVYVGDSALRTAAGSPGEHRWHRSPRSLPLPVFRTGLQSLEELLAGELPGRSIVPELGGVRHENRATDRARLPLKQVLTGAHSPYWWAAQRPPTQSATSSGTDVTPASLAATSGFMLCFWPILSLCVARLGDVSDRLNAYWCEHRS